MNEFIDLFLNDFKVFTLTLLITPFVIASIISIYGLIIAVAKGERNEVD